MAKRKSASEMEAVRCFVQENLDNFFACGTSFVAAARQASVYLGLHCSATCIATVLAQLNLSGWEERWHGMARKFPEETALSPRMWNRIYSWLLRHEEQIGDTKDLRLLARQAFDDGVSCANPRTIAKGIDYLRPRLKSTQEKKHEPTDQ